ncbi:hypothetical protein [Rhodococcus globerulus]|uniref:hypothetical protein n=1 Tax=Rhodococcus globerulus TaxID=33008 RepID=UPI00301A87D1
MMVLTVLLALTALATYHLLVVNARGRHARLSAAYFLRTLPLRLRLRWKLAQYKARLRKIRQADEQ